MKTLKNQHYIFLLLSCLLTLAVTAQKSNFDFVENKGQWDSHVKFMGDIGEGSFFLQKKGFTVLLHSPEDLRRAFHHSHPTAGNGGANKSSASLKQSPSVHGSPDGLGNLNDDSIVMHSHAYRVNFEGASDNVEIIADKMLPSYNNYLIGNDKTKWASNCKIYRALTYRNIYPGIDVRYYSDKGTLKYDIVINPGANPDRISMKYEGADKLSIKNNQLYIKTSVGDVKELSPSSYQFDKVDGKTDISCKYEIVNGNTVKFKVQNYSRDIPLIIDPTLIFSSFTGSTSDNWGFTATPGPDGSFFAGGIVFGNGYPVTPGAIQGTFGGDKCDMGITRFNPTGTTRIYSTFLGGSGNDFPLSMIADPQANLIIMARTYSPNFPGTLVGSGGGGDLAVIKLNAAGSGFIGSLRIGGPALDAANVEDQRTSGSLGEKSTLRFYGDDSRGEVILDAANNIYVASQSQSDSFPVKNAFQPIKAGGQDGVILKIDPTCNNIIFSSFIGGSGDDGIFAMDISPTTGNLYVAGTTASMDFPGNKTGVFQGSYQGGKTDGFVTEIFNDGSAIIRTTYLGTAAYDAVYGIKFDKFGYPYVMGISEGAWPVINAVYSNLNSHQFICKLQTDLSGLIYSTVFGSGPSGPPGSVLPNISPVAFLVDRCENVYVSGWGSNYSVGLDTRFRMAGTTSMATTADAIKTSTDGRDFYFIVIKKNASALLYGSFFGQGGGFGEHVDGGTSRFDKQGIIYQAICANCEGNSAGPVNPPYLVTAGVVAPFNGTGDNGCNLGALKIAFNFSGVQTGVKALVNAVYDTSGCVPLNVEFRDTVRNAARYEWHFGDGSPILSTTNFDVTHQYNAVGTYRVMLVGIDSTTCNIRDTSYINVRVRDDKAFLGFTTLKLQPCESLSYQFTNTSTFSPTAKPFGNQSFIWDFGDGARQVAGTGSVTHSYGAPGTYKVKLVMPDTNYCNSPDSIVQDLRVAPLVKALFETPPTGCAPYNAAFNNTSLAGQTFAWDFGDGSTSTAVNPVHLFALAGTYTIKLIVTDLSTCNKTDSTSVTINVSNKPTAAYTYSPTTPQQNFPYTFTNVSSADATRFIWRFGDGDTLSTRSRADIDHQYNKTGTFRACLAAYNNVGCVDTVCNSLQNIVVPRLDLPNAFTPLVGGPNSKVFVKGFGIGKMKWRVYNRFGNVVFESDSPSFGWDGTYKGVVQPMEVYAYTLEVEFTDGTKATKKGDITLIR